MALSTTIKAGIILAIAAIAIVIFGNSKGTVATPVASKSVFKHPVRVTGTNVKIRRFDDDKSEVIATVSAPDTVDNLSVRFRASRYISVRLRDGREGYVSTDGVAEGRFEK